MRHNPLPTLTIMAGLFFCLGGIATAQPGLTPALDALLPKDLQISDSTRPPNLASTYRVDFALPDAPAFVLLDESPSDILRPSTVREFAVDLSSFVDTSTGGFTIPQAFALEFSPGLLIGGHDLTLREYQATPWLYRMRLSAGTKRLSGATAPSELAVGIRTSFIDKSDLRTNKTLLKQVTDITDQMLVVVASAVGPGTGDGAEVIDPSQLSASQRATIDSLNGVLQKTILAAQQKAAEQWNAPALDLAVAALFSSKDSLASGLQTADVSGWLTYAAGFGTWGQLLLGGKAGMARANGPLGDSTTDSASSSTFDLTATVSSRLYIGTNNYKAFAELQWADVHDTNTLLINGGGEAMLRSGLWISFGGGVQRNLDAGTWDVISKFSVKLGLPFLE